MPVELECEAGIEQAINPETTPMKALHALFATALLATAAIAQASEITDFPIDTTRSTVSREAVRMQAQAAHQANQPRYDLSGPLVEPMSTRSRDEVRKEGAARLTRAEAIAMDHIGGM
jgi:hypothetical protein